MPNSMPNRCRNDAKLMQSMLYRCKLASTNLCHEHNLQSVPKRAQPPICAKTSTASILCQNEHNLQSVPKRAQPPICAKTSTTSNLCQNEHSLHSVPKRAQPPFFATSTTSNLCQNEHNLQSVPRAQPPICAMSTTSNYQRFHRHRHVQPPSPFFSLACRPGFLCSWRTHPGCKTQTEGPAA